MNEEVLSKQAPSSRSRVLYQCGIGMCPTVVYECVLGACPKAVYECGPAGCPKAEEENGVVSIFHPDEPEKGKVTMTAKEWNAMIKDAKPV